MDPLLAADIATLIYHRSHCWLVEERAARGLLVLTGGRIGDEWYREPTLQVILVWFFRAALISRGLERVSRVVSPSGRGDLVKSPFGREIRSGAEDSV